MKTLVVGLGRRGGDIAQKVIRAGGAGVEVLFADLDAEDLASRPGDGAALHLGASLPEGELRRNDMALAYRATMSEREAVERRLEGAGLVVLVAGLGGGTGPGGARAIAELARERGLPVVALVTRPFGLEGSERVGRGRIGLRQVRDAAELTVPFAQDAVLHLASRYARVGELMAVVDEIVVHAVQGLHALVADGGLSGIRALLATAREGAFSYGVANEPEGIVDAVRIAVAGPFLEGLALRKTQGLGVVIRSREPLDDADVGRALATVAAYTSTEASLLVATAVVPELEGSLELTLIPTGHLGEPAVRADDIWIPGPSG